jgi:hypothetical protein
VAKLGSSSAGCPSWEHLASCPLLLGKLGRRAVEMGPGGKWESCWKDGGRCSMEEAMSIEWCQVMIAYSTTTTQR